MYLPCHSRRPNRATLGIDDIARANIAIQGAAGKRLTYA